MSKSSKKPVSKQDKNPRSFSFNLVTYIDVEQVREYCTRDNVNNYAFIVHDNDVYDDDIKDNDGNVIHEKGTKKERHIHVVVTFRNARTWSAVVKDFADFEQNTRVEVVRDLESCLRYLTHDGEEGKYRYPVENVNATYGYFRGDMSRAQADNDALQIIYDMENGLSYLELVRRYGREFVIHYKQYREVCNLCYGRPADDYEKQMRNYIGDLEERLAEQERELEKLRFQNVRYEKQAMRSRKNVMWFTSSNAFVGEKVPKYIADGCPFDEE